MSNGDQLLSGAPQQLQWDCYFWMLLINSQIDYSYHTSKVLEGLHQTETIVNQELRTFNEVQCLVPRI